MVNKEPEADKTGGSASETDIAVDHESLRYIELAGDGSKLPAKEWGGYSQDFDDAKHVLDHENVEAHPSDSWGVVDIEDPDHTSLSLLIFDFDTYKLPDDFDASRVELPTDTLITESQNGGKHVYFAVHAVPGSLSESDFAVNDELPIDIRGSAVSHHVVAPADIPGVDGDYEIVNDAPIKTRIDPEVVAERIKIDGEPAITVDESGPNIDADWEQPETPDDMPTCYHAGLSLRREAPDDHNHTHKVNVLTALCGLAAGYEPDEVAEHMCGEFAPQDGETDLSDKEETEYQVQHLYDKLDAGQYSPPALPTLRDYGILGADEFCDGDCQIESHEPNPSEFEYVIRDWDWDEIDWDTVRRFRETVDWAEVFRLDEHGRHDIKGEVWSEPDDEDEERELIGIRVEEPIGPDDVVNVDLKPVGYAKEEHYGDAEETVRRKLGSLADRVIHCEPMYKLIYRLDELYDQKLNAQARSAAAHRLLQAMDFVTIGGADDKVIYCYDPETGVYEDDGREVIRSVVEAVSPSRSSDHEKREIVSKVADRTRENPAFAWEPRGEFADDEHEYRVVGNGILRLPTEQPDGSVCDPELLEFSPDLRARARVPTDYNPDVDTSEISEWLDEITGRREDRLAIEELTGNVLLPTYKHPKIGMLYGSGRNSKGVYLDVVAELLGGVESANVTANGLDELVENNFRTHKLIDALVNVNGELNGRKLSEDAASKLKELTGGEPQEGEGKHINSETFRNSAKLFFGSNSPLLPPETKESWQERWVPIELPYSFVPNPDPADPNQKPAEKGIKNRLTRDETLEAMLVLAVDGLARLEEQGDVSLPETPEKRLEQYELDADPISRMEHDVLEAAEFGASQKAMKYVPTGAVFAAYKELAREDGVEPTGRNKFFSILEDRCSEIPFDKSRPRTPDSVDDDREYALKGVRFRDDAAEYLSEYWLSHPWVRVEADEDDGAVDRSAPSHDQVTPLADIHRTDGYVTVEVEIAHKTYVNGGTSATLTVTDGDAMRDIVVRSRWDDDLDSADMVSHGDVVRFEKVKPEGSDLEVRPVSEVTVVHRESNDDDGDGDGDVVNDGDGDEDGDESSVPQNERVRVIRNLIGSGEIADVSKGAPKDEVVAAAKDRGISEEKARHTIDELKLAGEAYNPQDGVLRLS